MTLTDKIIIVPEGSKILHQISKETTQEEIEQAENILTNKFLMG